MIQNLDIKDIEGEIWKDIDDWEGIYRISNKGRIKSLIRENRKSKEKILKLSLHDGGYLGTSLRSGKTKENVNVHRLMAIAFIPNPNNHPKVLHKNSIPSDIRLENLYWGTQKQNMQDCIDTGKFHFLGKGEKHPTSKLKNNQVIEIRRLANLKIFTHTDIAKQFNVSRRLIGMIVSKKRWNHI